MNHATHVPTNDRTHRRPTLAVLALALAAGVLLSPSDAHATRERVEIVYAEVTEATPIVEIVREPVTEEVCRVGETRRRSATGPTGSTAGSTRRKPAPIPAKACASSAA